jgi:transcriptional regulator with XRE-family HTH domain
MPTSQAMSILHEVERSKPISEKTRAFQRRRLQNRFHRFLLTMFRQQQKNGLTQKELADRIGTRPEQVNRWLSIPSNLTLNTIADLLLGMAVDLDDPSATPLSVLAEEAHVSAKQRGKKLPLGRDQKNLLLWMTFPASSAKSQTPSIPTRPAGLMKNWEVLHSPDPEGGATSWSEYEMKQSGENPPVAGEHYAG